MKMLDNDKLDQELKRLSLLKKYELDNQNKIVAGIDEAGRGPLAGPVVAACVIIDMNYDYLYLNDSKKLSEKKRDILYDQIIDTSLSYGIGIVNNDIIDKINILEATHIAMREAYIECNKLLNNKINKNIDILLVDALKIKNVSIEQIPIIHGDSISLSIAAASIIAKVTRDRIMKNLDNKYDIYNFSKHKGYGTKEHIELLKKYGPCDIHRKTFIKNFITI